MATIARSIQNNEFTFVERQSDRVTVWRGVVKDHDLILVYDTHRHTLVTALTPEMWEFNKGTRANFW